MLAKPPCARCGHLAAFHNAERGCEEEVNPEDDTEWCPCEVYRTPEQQDAWEGAKQIMADNGPNYSPGDYVDALARLLELYP